MKKIILLALAAISFAACIYDFKALSNRGKEVNLADYKGQGMLI